MRGEVLLRGRGWDVATVDGQGLSSVTDETLIEICRVEDRAVVSFDKDFADVLHFPPVRYRGIIVLRLPEPVTLPMILHALARVADLAETRNVVGRLWIVSIDRIREYEPPPGDSDKVEPDEGP